MSRDLDTVTDHYAVCALWSSHEYREEGQEEPDNFEWAGLTDIADETMASFREDCEAMIYAARNIPGSEWWSDEQFGHDFWLTRNGHGAGYWGRGQGVAGEELSDLACTYGEVNLWTDEDGKVRSE